MPLPFRDRRKCRRQSYFTFPELMLAMALMVILVLTLFRAMANIQDFWSATHYNVEVFENARRILKVFREDISSITVQDLDGEKILIDADGTGTRMVNFIVNDVGATGSSSTLREVGYSINGDTLLRWQTSEHDSPAWNFLDTDPSAWAGDGSWGQTTTVSGGVIDLQINFYKEDTAAPYYVQYNAVSDSDTLPAYATVDLTLIHPKTVALSTAEKLRTKQKFSTRVSINDY